jgi:endoglucanase Acf2
LEATDADDQTINKIDKLIKYSIVNGDSNNNFIIDEKKGYLITSKNILDREVYLFIF